MSEDFLKNRGEETAVVNDKRALSDESIRETLPNEGISLTNRPTVDLSTTISAEETRRGTFLNPDIEENLLRINNSIADTNIAIRAKEASKDLVDEKAFKEDLLNKKLLTETLRFNSWVAGENTKAYATLIDDLNTAKNSTKVNQYDVLQEWTRKRIEFMNTLAQDGYMSAAEHIRNHIETVFNEQIKTVVDNDHTKYQNKLQYDQQIGFIIYSNQSLNDGGHLPEVLVRFVDEQGRSRIYNSGELDKAKAEEAYHKDVNTHIKSAADQIESLTHIGVMTAQQGITALLGLHTINDLSISGVRPTNAWEQKMIAEKGIAVLEYRLEGTNEKVLKSTSAEEVAYILSGKRKEFNKEFSELTESELALLKELDILSERNLNSIAERFRVQNADGSYSFVAIGVDWKAALDMDTRQHILDKIAKIKGNKTTFSAKEYIELDDKVYGYAEIKKGNYDIPALANMSDAEIDASTKNNVLIPIMKEMESTNNPGRVLELSTIASDRILTKEAYKIARSINTLNWNLENGGERYLNSKADDIHRVLDDTAYGVYDFNAEALILRSQDGTILYDMRLPDYFLASLDDASKKSVFKNHLIEAEKTLRALGSNMMANGDNSRVNSDQSYQINKRNYDGWNVDLTRNVNGIIGLNIEATNNKTEALTGFINSELAVTNNNETPNVMQEVAKGLYGDLSKYQDSKTYIGNSLANGKVLANAGLGSLSIYLNGSNISNEMRDILSITGAAQILYAADSTIAKQYESYMLEHPNNPYYKLSLDQLHNTIVNNMNLKIKGTHFASSIRDSVLQILDEEGVDISLYPGLTKVAAIMVASAATEDGIPVSKDAFRKIVRAVKDKNGMYNKGPGYVHPRATVNLVSLVDLDKNHSTVKGVHERLTGDSYTLGDSGNGSTWDVLNNNGMKVRITLAGTEIPMQVTKNTGGLPVERAMLYQALISSSLVNLSYLSDIIDSKKAQVAFNKYLPGYDSEKMSVVYNKLFRTAANTKIQDKFMSRITNDPGYVPGSIKSNLDPNVVKAIINFNGESIAETKFNGGDIENKKRMADFVNFAYNEMSNKNTMSVSFPSNTLTADNGDKRLYTNEKVVFGCSISSVPTESRKATGGKPHFGYDAIAYMNSNGTKTPFVEGMPYRLSREMFIKNIDDPKAVVTKVGYDANGYGNYIIVLTKSNERYLLAHFSTIHVNEGQDITPSTIIGRLGRTGNAKKYTDKGKAVLHIERQIKKGKGWVPVYADSDEPIMEGKYSTASAELNYDPDSINIIANNGITKTREMGFFNITKKDALYLYNNFKNVALSKEDAELLNRKYGELSPTNIFHNQGVLAARLAIGKELFKKFNADDHAQIALAAIHPGVKLDYVDNDHDVILKNKSLNDIIKLDRDGDLPYGKYEGKWVLPKRYKEVAAKVKEYYKNA